MAGNRNGFYFRGEINPFGMKRIILSLSLLVAASAPVWSDGNGLTQKEIDNGGTGLFKAVAVSEPTLGNFVVYRPKDLYWASCREKKLPILLWGNGGCMDTSVGYERMLVEIASQGYVVIALGELQQVYGDRPEVHTPSSMMADAIRWICRQAQDRESPYYDCVDTTLMAAAGHSCGGAQVLANAADPHLKTYVICNAGMGDMEMAGASRRSLDHLHGKILYLTGGPDDVAYANARLDVERIDHVPVYYADMPAAGHGGTYREPQGGSFGRMVLSWLDWTLKGREEPGRIFQLSDLKDFPGWTMTQKNAEGRVSELWLERDGRRIYGLQSVPDCPVKKVAIVSHGFNGSCEFARDYFQTLNRLGYLVYAMEFPGGSVRSRSDSNTMNMSVLDEKEDVKAAVRYFCRQPDVDREHIVLIGESQGGLVSALAAADLPQEISGLVLVYPALCIPDDWNGRYPRVADIPDTTWLWGVPLSKRFFLELRPMNVYREITKYQGPVQIIHGSRDAVVPLRYSEEAMKRYRDAHLGVIPGAGHGFGPAERRVANRFVEEFLTR